MPNWRPSPPGESPDASKLNRLAGIIQPTFVAVGDNDTMMHTKT
jgi:hypothetical protein